MAAPSFSPIVVVGIGVRCAIGLAAAPTAAAVRAGISGYKEHPWMIDKVGQPIVAAFDTLIDPDVGGAARFAILAQSALDEALEPLSSGSGAMPSVKALIGLPERRPGLPDGIEKGLRDLVTGSSRFSSDWRVAFLPSGNASGLMAMQAAAAELRSGRSQFCLVGGVDSYMTPETLEWMDDTDILKTSANRNGFVPGEAAGLCLLTTGATAGEFGLPLLGWMESWGFAREESPIRTQTICVGRGLSEAIKQAITTLRLPEDQIDNAICDLNGEPYRSEEFAFTTLRTQTSFVDATRFETPADCWGDVGAASGVLFANLALAAAQRGYAKGPRALLWASSIGGDRAAVVIRVPSNKREDW